MSTSPPPCMRRKTNRRTKEQPDAQLGRRFVVRSSRNKKEERTGRAESKAITARLNKATEQQKVKRHLTSSQHDHTCVLNKMNAN